MTKPMPEPKTCSGMDEIRAEIDRLDRLIVPLLAERLDYVRQAAGFKPDRAQVVVPWRIEEVVAKARALAADANTDSDVVERIYRALVDASIAWEGGHYDRTRNETGSKGPVA